MQKSDQHLTPLQSPARSRGRPRAFDREAALTIATHLFWKQGYEATSISDLTEAMGIGSPSLYAAFGSKEGLYKEALAHYRTRYDAVVWASFDTAPSAREAVSALLRDSALGLCGDPHGRPRGCMVALSSVGGAGQAELGELGRAARAVTLERLKARIQSATAGGEIPATVDAGSLARFVQNVQFGMSIQARDGSSVEDLEEVASVAMSGWDAQVRQAE